MSELLLLAQSSDGGGGGSAVILIFYLIVIVIGIASMWVIFGKAGEPGWAAIIPIYNYIVLLRIVGRPWWWLLLAFIPIVGFIVAIMIYMDLAKAFGKGTGFGCGLLILPIIFFPILAFGDAQYLGPPN